MTKTQKRTLIIVIILLAAILPTMGYQIGYRNGVEDGRAAVEDQS